MKRFILFGGDCYYSIGGFHDFISSHHTTSQAIEAGTKAVGTGQSRLKEIEWFHIFDCVLKTMVWANDERPYGVDDGLPTLPNLKE